MKEAMPELPPLDGVMMLAAKFGRAEYADGIHNNEESLAEKERLFSDLERYMRELWGVIRERDSMWQARLEEAVKAERERAAEIVLNAQRLDERSVNWSETERVLDDVLRNIAHDIRAKE